MEQREAKGNLDYLESEDLLVSLVFSEKLKDPQVQQGLKVLLEKSGKLDQKETMETMAIQAQPDHPDLPENPDLLENPETLDPEDLQAMTVFLETAVFVLCQELNQDTNHSRSHMVHSNITFFVNKDS